MSEQGTTSTASVINAQDKPGDGMVMLGIAVLVIGVLAAVTSFFLPTSIHVPGDYSSLSDYRRSGDVINIGKLQLQLMVFQGGVAVSVIGALLYAAGRIVLAVGRVPRGPDGS